MAMSEGSRFFFDVCSKPTHEKGKLLSSLSFPEQRSEERGLCLVDKIPDHTASCWETNSVLIGTRKRNDDHDSQQAGQNLQL